MLAKYHLLLQQDSTRIIPSAEEVMLSRFWDAEERQNLMREKEEYRTGSLFELPQLPLEWAKKYEEIYGNSPPDSGSIRKVQEPVLLPEVLKQSYFLKRITSLNQLLFQVNTEPPTTATVQLLEAFAGSNKRPLDFKEASLQTFEKRQKISDTAFDNFEVFAIKTFFKVQLENGYFYFSDDTKRPYSFQQFESRD